MLGPPPPPPPSPERSGPATSLLRPDRRPPDVLPSQDVPIVVEPVKANMDEFGVMIDSDSSRTGSNVTDGMSHNIAMTDDISWSERNSIAAVSVGVDV